MLFKSLSAAVMMVLAASAVTVPAYAANLVVNGGFETVTNGLGQLDYSTSALGWRSNGYNFIFDAAAADTIGAPGQYPNGLSLWGINNGGLDTIVSSSTGGNFAAADGAFLVQPIQQTLTGLVVGKQYNVAFDWAAAQQFGYSGDTTEQWLVSLGGQTIATPVYSNVSHSFSGWMHQKFTFTFDGASSVLSFLAVGTPNGEPPFSLLDGVSANEVGAVPEPAAWASMIVGLGLTGIGMRRRRSNAVNA